MGRTESKHEGKTGEVTEAADKHVLLGRLVRLRDSLAVSADDQEAFEEDPRGFLLSRGLVVLGVSSSEEDRLGEILESTPRGMRFAVLDSVVGEASRAADPNNPDPQIPWFFAVANAFFAANAVAVANLNFHANANANFGGSGLDASVVARRGGEQYSVVVDESFFSSAAAASLSGAGLSENRVRVLVRTAARQQEISPAGDGTVVLAYPYHGRTLELVGRVEGATLRITDGTLAAHDATAPVHA